ncbi:MAG: molybdopterin molybdenumtransferase MoeA [Polaromonas sp.]|nr:molybdopterin molybdenumtransferase MoeA [Polaromonas sp.]
MTAPAPTSAPPTRQPLMALDQALSSLLASAQPLADTEVVDTFNADGRVLAQSLVSALHVPPQDNSSMDGYAVRCADLSSASAASPVVLPVTQRIAAGHSGQPLQPGTVARIFTGAPVPAGADAIVMQEEVVLGAGPDSQPLASFSACPPTGAWIRRAGEDVTRGAEVLHPGTRLGPAELGLAASLGLAQLTVCRRPRVALFSTGDELVMPGTVPPEAMAPGAIYNSNRFFLRALLQRLGCEVSDLGIVPDNRAATVQALTDAAQTHDLILTSGGVSVGEEDHIKPAVQQLGGLDLWQIAMKPGKPFAHGHIRRADPHSLAHFIGLPGNPVSSFMTFVLLVRPFLLRLQGVADVACPAQTLPAHFTVTKADRRREFLRVRRNAAGGLDLFANQSSGVLTSAVWGDGVVDLPAGTTVAPGDAVRFLAFADLLA